MEQTIIDDLEAILGLLPKPLRAALPTTDDLQEIILDLGRVPTARYLMEEVVLAPELVELATIDSIIEKMIPFDADNRSGIERTLHRIAAIRNRQDRVIGLTMRVGRAVYGTTEIIRDLIESGKSVLLLGRPGIGKTTSLREAARILAESKRVVIVDTSNEIGGGGDVPHPAIGRARRMQVNNPARQHEVMIEAVENHSPEVIVIDEIGRELEATAARTIAERGVQLIGTAHGNTLDNILLNPLLADLVGGIESVTLSDEEARRRGTQKTVLERRAPPTFDILVEMQARGRVVVHGDVSAAVDGILRGKPLASELRTQDSGGGIVVEVLHPTTHVGRGSSPFGNQSQRTLPWDGNQQPHSQQRQNVSSREMIPAPSAGSGQRPSSVSALRASSSPTNPSQPTLFLYLYGIPSQRVELMAQKMRLPVTVVASLEEATALATLRPYYRRQQRPIAMAEERGMPIYVLRSNTMHQIENFLMEVFNITPEVTAAAPGDWHSALAEVQAAIEQVDRGAQVVDLAPQNASIRRKQHQVARASHLISHSFGKDPERYVRIFAGGEDL